MKKIISIFTILSVTLTMVSTFSSAAADNTMADITEISTLAELEAFRDSVNNGNTYAGKTVTLKKDIELSSKYGEYKNSWIPIGNSNTPAPDAQPIFAGTFDGGGHSISNVYIACESETAFGDAIVGLFGVNSGTIKRLSVEGDYTNLNGWCTGGIAGISFGNIDQCCFIGNVNSQNHTGGIVGGNCRSGTITDCYNTATIHAANCGGGIAGTNDGGTITRCYNLGKVANNFEGLDSQLGSICVGSIHSVTDCYYLAATCDKGVNTGTEEDTATALALEQFADKTNFSKWDFDFIWEMDETSTLTKPVLRSRALPQTITELYTAEDLKTFRDSVNSGNTYKGKTVKLMNDIALDINEPWSPIGGAYYWKIQYNAGGGLSIRSFSGTFDGQSHTISGVNLSECVGWSKHTRDRGHQGFFGRIYEAELKNFTLRGILQNGIYTENTNGDTDITYIGAVAAEAKCSDMNNVNSYVDAQLENTDCCDTLLGGIAGSLDYYTCVDNCNNYGSLSVINNNLKKRGGYIGGIAADMGGYAYLEGCANYGAITVTGNCIVGGINGNMSRNSGIDSCANYGAVTVTAQGAGYVGGIVGSVHGNSGDLIENCLNIGKMDCSTANAGSVGPIGGSTYNSTSLLINNYYLDTSVDTAIENSSQGTSVAKTAKELAAGEVAYLLNNKKSDGTLTWYQTIGKDAFPVLDKTHFAVSYNGSEYYNHLHTLIHHEYRAATCTVDGNNEYWQCAGETSCNKMFSDANGATEIKTAPIIPAEHQWGEWEIAAEPTETEEGVAICICARCGETETWPIPVLEYMIDCFDGEVSIFVTHDDTYAVVFASYDDAGKFLHATVQNMPLSKTKNMPISVPDIHAGHHVKVMLWDSLDSMRPLAQAEIPPFTE